MIIGLFDMDSLMYQVCFTTEGIDEAKIRLQHRVNEILAAVRDKHNYDQIVFFQGNKGNFRYEIYPEYKANRTQEKPEHYNDLVAFCRERYSPESGVGIEVDDLIADEVDFLKAMGEDVFIIAIDKDFLQIPNVDIYLFNKGEWVTTTKESALHEFANQMLMGDSADNIKGVPGVGKKKAERMLEDVVGENKISYIRKVIEVYKGVFGDDWKAEVELNYKLLKLGRQKK